ncbi:hypothetical protein [Bradyrhizobium sp. S3.7.6]
MLQVMDDDKMPQDAKAQGGGSNQAQKMGQIKQAGRAAQINLTIDKTQFTLNHPNGDVNFNCKNFKVNASADIKLIAAANMLARGLSAILVAAADLFLKGGATINAKSGANLADPDWGSGANDPPITS